MKGKWNHLEDDALKCAVEEMGAKRWKLVAERIPGRNHRQCFQRWMQIRNENANKDPWSQEEDAQLRKAIPPNKGITGRPFNPNNTKTSALTSSKEGDLVIFFPMTSVP